MNNYSNISRREFMARLGLLGSLALSVPATLLAETRQKNADQPSPEWMDEPQWQTIAQVQEILFPAGDDIPGAGDIGANIYLHMAIENPDADGEDKDFIFRGVGWLNDLTNERHQKTFLQLTLSQQEEIIDVIVQSRAGRNWVSLLLTYIIEALVSAPIYGGNRNNTGWKWLEYQPGFPLPPADKTWDRLLQRRGV